MSKKITSVKDNISRHLQENCDERRIVDDELEIRQGDDENELPKIGGYAIVFERTITLFSGYKEVIKRGALDKAKMTDVLARIEHEGGLSLLGRTSNDTLKLEIDQRGLKYEVQPADTQAARDLIALVRRKDIRQSSFAFRIKYPDGEKLIQQGKEVLREIHQISELIDVSPVTKPAYPSTTVAVRSLDKFKEELKPSNREYYERKNKLLDINKNI